MLPHLASEVVSLGQVSRFVHFLSQAYMGNLQQALDLDEEIIYLVRVAWNNT
jgi:hypothetical protein